MVTRLSIWFIGFTLLLGACSACKDQNNSLVPLVSVDITINVNEPDFFNLTNITGWEYVTGGSRGILIYRNNDDQFTAYDRHSTYEVDNNCQVEVLDDGITIKDKCGESTWLILDGSIITGPAVQPLRQYNTSFQGSILRVWN